MLIDKPFGLPISVESAPRLMLPPNLGIDAQDHGASIQSAQSPGDTRSVLPQIVDFTQAQPLHDTMAVLLSGDTLVEGKPVEWPEETPGSIAPSADQSNHSRERHHAV
jgi:hypothetical protein